MKMENLKHKLDIQLFAEETETAETVTSETEESQTQPDEAKTFTEKEVNKLIQGRIAKERRAWEQRLEDQHTEAERLATMNETQKKRYEEEKRMNELAKREAEVTKRELTATAKVTLIDKGLPAELSDILNYADADACNDSIETVSKAFQSAVQKAVEDKLKGGTPPKKVPQDESSSLEEQIKNAMGVKKG